MKITVTKTMFHDAFTQSTYYSTAFSYEGRAALFDYFEQYEEATGEEIDLDVVAIACDFSEYSSVEEYNKFFSSAAVTTREELEDKTTMIPVGDKGFIIQNL